MIVETREIIVKILVVEDSPSIRTVIRYISESQGWEIREAIDCQQALSQFEQSKDFDLVIVDHGSQTLAGLEVLRQLKANGYAGKCIVLSLDARERFIEEVKGLGISSWLHKPFSNEHFCKAIDHAMGASLIGQRTA